MQMLATDLEPVHLFMNLQTGSFEKLPNLL